MSDLTRRIRLHYNLLAPFYYALWGQHVHHGFWSDAADVSPQSQAQERLIRELYAFGGAPRCSRLLDVGCGYGGSLIWFARHTGAEGLGMTLSPLQRLIGQVKIRRAGFHNHLDVRVADAQEPWPVATEGVDLVWCVECSEHLEDRAHFAHEAYRVLRAGGVVCVAAWLAGANAGPEAIALRHEVERGMLCHPFGTQQDYMRWFADAGFVDVQSRLITRHVARTWDICIAMRDRPILRWIAARLGGDVRAFTDSFTALQRAYRDGAMEYGLFTAHKPGLGVKR